MSNWLMRQFDGRISTEVRRPDQVLMDAEHVLVVDVSSSMAIADAGEGEVRRARWEVMVDALRRLKEKFGRSVAVIAFSDEHQIVTEVVPEPNGSTNMAGALLFLQPLSPHLKRIVLVSDGEPNSEQETEDAARRLACTLDCVYCGPKGGRGAEFLRSLVKLRGRSGQAGEFKLLELKSPDVVAGEVAQLLLTGG